MEKLKSEGGKRQAKTRGVKEQERKEQETSGKRQPLSAAGVHALRDEHCVFNFKPPVL
jgi:hypothetical protein